MLVQIDQQAGISKGKILIPITGSQSLGRCVGVTSCVVKSLILCEWIKTGVLLAPPNLKRQSLNDIFMSSKDTAKLTFCISLKRTDPYLAIELMRKYSF